MASGRWPLATTLLIVLLLEVPASAGPELTLREFASSQVKKGVRSIGMGGDGATWGNYALVYKDAGTALIDYGLVGFHDTGNTFTFTAVGFTTPTFWDGAALYLIAMAQHATGLDVWSLTPPSPYRPPSHGDGSNEAVFLKFAKPLSHGFSVGVMLSYEVSQMTLVPQDGGAAIRYSTAWRPSGGAGVAWQPVSWLMAGARVILNHDLETRIDSTGARSAMARSYEYRLGASVMPWKGGILDAGIVVLDRADWLDQTFGVQVSPTVGVEQAVIDKRLWLRAGLDETTWTAGMSARVWRFKLDLAYLHNLAAARTGDIFGLVNNSIFATLNFDYRGM